MRGVEVGTGRLRNAVPRGDGRGGTVDAPICAETLGLVDGAMLDDLAATFGESAKPAPIYWSHESEGRRSKSGEMPVPALGTIRRVWREGSELWAELDLGPKAWEAVVEDRGFHSFSIEADREGDRWRLRGGIFTNTPAADVRFAAEEPERITLRDDGSAQTRALEEAYRIAKARGVSVAVALEVVRSEKPDLWRRVRAEREPSPSRDPGAATFQAPPKEDRDAVQRFLAECHRLSYEHGIPFNAAMDKARALSPDLWRAATAHYRR